MDKKNIPAFPNPKSYNSQPIDQGMDLRDYFAAKAMQAELSLWKESSPTEVQRLEISDEAYKMADSMLVARKK